MMNSKILDILFQSSTDLQHVKHMIVAILAMYSHIFDTCYFRRFVLKLPRHNFDMLMYSICTDDDPDFFQRGGG